MGCQMAINQRDLDEDPDDDPAETPNLLLLPT